MLVMTMSLLASSSEKDTLMSSGTVTWHQDVTWVFEKFQEYWLKIEETTTQLLGELKILHGRGCVKYLFKHIVKLHCEK